MPLTGDHVPSSQDWVREEAELYARTGHGTDDRALVLLSTKGAKTGAVRRTPLMRVEHAGVYAVVASWAGADVHPSWYLNLQAHPHCSLQDGLTHSDRLAREVTGPERSGWWSRACVAFPSYADYQSRTRRKIPVLVLEP